MKFYITMRPLKLPFLSEYIVPDHALQYNFQGILFEYKLICWKPEFDGRMMYEITLDEAYTDQEKIDLKAAMVEGLSMFGAHLKTSTSAKAFADSVCECTWVVNGDAISIDPASLPQ